MITAIIILAVSLRKKCIEVNNLKDDLTVERNFGDYSEKERHLMGKAIEWFYDNYKGEIPNEVFCWASGFEPEKSKND